MEVYFVLLPHIKVFIIQIWQKRQTRISNIGMRLAGLIHYWQRLTTA